MSTPNIPPISDHLPIAIRAFAGPTYRVLPDPNKRSASGPKKQLPASPWTLIFDTETTVDPGQALRFGTYQLRNDGDLDEAGIFYDPDGVSAAELAVLSAYADANGQILRTREGFVDEVFFARAWALRATIVGFNLPFDISRLAIRHGTARAPIESETAMRSAFTFKLSAQKIYPNVCVKHMSQRSAQIWFAGTMQQRTPRGQRNRQLPVPVRRGHYIDVKTLAAALFARSFSLAGLSKFLKVENPKLDFDEFEGLVTPEMVRYAVGDVQTTWECYVELKARIERLGLTHTLPEKIYSEASIGKGYLREMGVAPWEGVKSLFPRDLLAKIMGSYFGGRSEIRIRRELRQVILCDFLSMYPTVCTLMGLWRFVIADGMTWRDATAETRELLDSIDLATLQIQPTWQRLVTLVRVLPDGDIFPVRAAYSGEPQTTIGANNLTSKNPVWFTLADCIAAKLLTGKAPVIIEAITFAPRPLQSDLRAVNIGGNPEYRVDPTETDFFKRVIELRQSIKRRMKGATSEEYEALDTEQNALKICANSTSYGIYIEVNVETRSKPQLITVHPSTCDHFRLRTDKSELPGTYFHPLLGTLITGAARLMLAIAERLVTDRGLEWSFCDTDSMAIAKPNAMPAIEFAAQVKSVVQWFEPLNPYDFGGSILKIEDENTSLETGEPETLYCWAISSKRYALFNLDAHGCPVMRKVSAHGLGHLRPPYANDDAPANLPTPHKSVLGKGIERWHVDLWYQIVSAAIAGHPDRVHLDYHPALSHIAISRYAATTPELLHWFTTYNRDRQYRDEVKPFGFLLSMMVRLEFGGERLIGKPSKGRSKKIGRIKPIAPFDLDHAKALTAVFDRETGEAVSLSLLKSYAEALSSYHLQPESKFLNADYFDRGTTRRRHVHMIGTHHIGKESHDWERQALLGVNLDSEIAYGLLIDDLPAKLKSLIDQFGERSAAKAMHLTLARLRALASGLDYGTDDHKVELLAASLPAAVRLCEKLSHERHAEVQELRQAVKRDGLRETARKFGVDPSNLRRKLAGITT